MLKLFKLSKLVGKMATTEVIHAAASEEQHSASAASGGNQPLNPNAQTVNPNPLTLNPNPKTFNTQPQTSGGHLRSALGQDGEDVRPSAILLGLEVNSAFQREFIDYKASMITD